MEDTFRIKQPEGALIFLSMQEFAAFCRQFKKDNLHFEVEGEPDAFPCIGFPVHRYYDEGRMEDKCVFAFVYLHMNEDDKKALYAKSEWEPLDRFESALLMS